MYHPGPEAVGGVGLVEDRLSILWSQEKRFRGRIFVPEAVGGVGLVEDRLSILWSQEKRFR